MTSVPGYRLNLLCCCPPLGACFYAKGPLVAHEAAGSGACILAPALKSTLHSIPLLDETVNSALGQTLLMVVQVVHGAGLEPATPSSSG